MKKILFFTLLISILCSTFAFADSGTISFKTGSTSPRIDMHSHEYVIEEKYEVDPVPVEENVPESGELYHSNRYYSSSATITIYNDISTDTYIKFYSETNELVFSAYVRKGDRIKVQVPGGYYYMNQSFGDKWYGDRNMFGSDGIYYSCSVGNIKTFYIKRGGRYTISSSTQGAAFDMLEIKKNEF